MPIFNTRLTQCDHLTILVLIRAGNAHIAILNFK